MPAATTTNPTKSITSREKADVILGVLSILLRTPFTVLFTYPLSKGKKAQPTLAKELARVLLRRLLDRFTVAQVQWALPSSTSVYKDWVASKAAKEDASPEPFTELIGDDGAKIHWVGRKDAKKVVLHFHGGGFVMTLSPGHLKVINYLRREVKRRSGVEVKTAFLEYTLVPDNTYPTQFRQAVCALKHIIDSGISPADIVVTGDSAGGQLALQLISHIMHPHPDIPPLALAEPLAGVLPVSPWVVFNSSAPSFVGNNADVISPKRLLEWGGVITRETAIAEGQNEAAGYWGEPLKAPCEWWGGAEKATRRVLVVYGEYEAFRDDNAELVKKMREGTAGTNVDIKDIEEREGVHIGPMIDAFVDRAPSELSKSMAGWVNDCLE